MLPTGVDALPSASGRLGRGCGFREPRMRLDISALSTEQVRENTKQMGNGQGAVSYMAVV